MEYHDDGAILRPGASKARRKASMEKADFDDVCSRNRFHRGSFAPERRTLMSDGCCEENLRSLGTCRVLLTSRSSPLADDDRNRTARTPGARGIR